jgi:anti-sigma factor RsiW
MSDMDQREAEMDSLLRRSMSAPVPHLSADFHQALSRELRRRSQPASQFGRILLTGYGGVSAVVSIVVMRGQGLGWGVIAVMTLGSLVTLELARRLQRRQWGMAPK